MASLTSTFITPEEYLERERLAETKSEYYRGEIFAMAGATLTHARIVRNLVQKLGIHLGAGGCEVFSGEVRLYVPSIGLYTYPDVMVICGSPALTDSHVDTIMNPVVVIEVLSESTKDCDRGQKFENYRTISSLMEYVTIAEDRAHIEVWTRQPGNGWLLKETDGAAATSLQSFSLQSIGVELQLSEVYEKVDLVGRQASGTYLQTT
jgi:Uma2 family endonuclease